MRIGNLAPLVQQAVGIHEDLGGMDLGLIVGLLPHRHGDQPPNAHPGGSCTRIDDPLVGELLPGDPQRRQHTGQGHRRRALDVVVEAGDLPVVAIQDLEGDVLVKILPLDETVREDFLHGGDEGVEHLPVRLALEATVPVAEVVRIAQQLGVVGPHVEAHRQAVPGMDSGRGAYRATACPRECPCRPRPGPPVPGSARCRWPRSAGCPA